MILEKQTSVLPLMVAVASMAVVQSWAAPAADIEFFEKKIRPILVERCYECHSTQAKKTKGGLALDSQHGVAKGGDSGPTIVVGDPEKSRLIEAVRYKNQDMQMPPKQAMPAAEVALLEEWVRRGAPDPRTETPAAAHGPHPVNIEEGRKHWAFQPLAEVAVPSLPAEAAAQVKNPIDAFVLARMSGAGLPAKFAPKADPRTLARRLSYTLTGLPPRSALAADLKTQIDDLLSVPQYGEHWARHWLDIARYADSNGLDENVALGHAWRYRDYVVRAFNNDKPYDQFVIEQLAGDLLKINDESSRNDALAATGFLALGAKVLAEPDMQKLQLDIIDEQIDTLGRAFLGMTLGCVRCHDHKFDPIRQDDYYALAAIFKSTRSLSEKRTGAIKYWYEHNLATKGDLDAQAKHEAAAKAKAAELKKFTNAARAKLKTELTAAAATYLAAARELPANAGIVVINATAEKYHIRSRYLAAARLYLDRHPQHPVFQFWRDSASASAVQTHYQAEYANKQDKAAQDTLTDIAGFLAVPDKDADAFDPATLATIEAMQKDVMAFEDATPEPPAIMGVTEGDVARTLPIHIRGSYLTLGKPVERGFPEVMRTSYSKPILPAQQSGRLQLAKWIASPEHPLTARVIVNRVWRWHFGTGLVATVDNYGTLGDKPSHPELLDWLARWFIENDWSMKALHRLILTSATYQQASGPSPMTDPENRLLTHFPLRRLTAEELRDSLLAASDQLSLQVGGKTIPQRNKEFVFNHTSKDHTTYESPRRALYLPIIRNHLYDILEQFDYPDPTTPTGSRNSTTVAPQALILLNSPLVMDVADHLANALGSQRNCTDDEKITNLYQRLYYRLPTAPEADRCLKFISRLQSSPDAAKAWPLLVQTLLASNEFVFLK